MTLYPPVEPYAIDRIDVGGGHELHVEQVGSPAGVPVIFLHGGPGGGLIPLMRQFFDPGRYRVVLFDQRGCGRSTPPGELRDNTTGHLVADIETIRAKLGVPSWLVFGGSWGSTLGLAYAQAHPERVTGLILRGIYLVRRSERDWIIQGRYDLCCPPAMAYDLARRWPEADLQMVPDAGHSSLEPGITDRLIAATDRFADLLSPPD